MGFFDNPFGGIFDFNGDGHTDVFEAGLGFAMMQETLKEAERADSANAFSLDSDLDCFETSSRWTWTSLTISSLSWIWTNRQTTSAGLTSDGKSAGGP